MCDYSLEAYRSRPAREGEKYESYRFTSGSIGFTAPGDKSVAVCMACDMKLRLEDLPESVRDAHNVSAKEDVTFVRLDMGPYHDGVRFANGKEITLQDLGTNVKVSVINALTSPARKRETVDVV